MITHKLVPVEPTPEILTAMSVAMGMEPLPPTNGNSDYPITGKQSTIRQCYAAVLADAPAVLGESVMLFEMRHPWSKESRTIEFTRKDVSDGLEDLLYDKLAEAICHCDPVGETNVVGCNCDEYIHDFGLVPDAPRSEKTAPDVAALVEALEAAHQFITSGVALGYIQMPDADTPDFAHETLPVIEAALAAYRNGGES